ncbi:Type II secretion system (T2SS), protein F [uncultured archaeon]|nr:Type II secretion system (T2SS), protein F [uncultured archaeon]
MANMAYEMIGRMFSRTQIRGLAGMLDSAGIDFIAEAFAGIVVIACVLASILAYFVSISVEPVRSLLFRVALLISSDLTVSSAAFFSAIAVLASVLAAAGCICLGVYVALLLMADSRRRKVEEVMPDFLSLSAANVRAGMTIDQAMWYAAKPEFGILSVEVSTVAKRTFGGVPFNKAIDHLAERFNSKPVRRTVALIKQGIASGGQIADILERTADDARQMRILRKEISASLLMYVIFIVFAGAIGTPFLFAISGNLVAIIEGVFLSMPASSGTAAASTGLSSFAMPSKPTVSSADFFIFTILTSIITAIFSSLIIGVISKGSKKDGVAYLPFLLIISLTIFFVVNYFLEGFLANVSI